MTKPDYSALLLEIKFNQDKLVAAIAQQVDSKEVLMMAWMNEESIIETLTTHQVCYYSRSRKKLWRKGETSGQTQTLIEMRLDCDGDALLLIVNQKGVACHTGRRSCFYRAYRENKLVVIDKPQIEPTLLYNC
ncbi:Phosphoribosyl-AMP cyclohydrolase [Commensalibacter sp. Nvir]|uniref:phosphoribosyl-AMP cyclohydrolase n=1 Tax=Commensalibacter sp. Nvir TaxID=3069817 RepID=UPI002D251501|nr:Phosphoribosyl-AMP cyclohydrolase [Commensalibacter sp. Nvir]